MAMARFKDLCIDATDLRRLGRFWAAVLGRRFAIRDDHVAHLDGVRGEERIWVNAVPEPKTVKHRVHFDVHAKSVAEIEALGASVVRPVDDEIRWTVMADVEGGEFCVFVSGDPPAQRLHSLVVDAVDAQAQARWWHEVLAGRLVRHRAGWWSVANIAGTPFDEMLFIDVPEPKTVKNRIHWDLVSDDADALVAMDSRVLREPDNDIWWRVFADPEGNEFCVFPPAD